MLADAKPRWQNGRRSAIYREGGLSGPSDLMDTMLESQLLDRVDVALNRIRRQHRRQVEAEAEQGRVVLRGTVGSYYQKQLAQEAVRSVEGVDEVDNHIEVDWR